MVELHHIGLPAVDFLANHLSGSALHESLTSISPILAQHVDDPKLFESVQKSFTNFVQSGQVWALIIGVVFGYMFRSFTSS